MKGEIQIARYIPRRFHQYIDEIEIEPDFDCRTNRTVQHYRVWFTDGTLISATGLKNLIAKFKTL